MDLGLGNLKTLKLHLLSAPSAVMQANTDFDVVLANIGRGVAGMFDVYCNRKLARLAGAMQVFSGDRDRLFLERYPVETITSLQAQEAVGGAWAMAGQGQISLDPNTGILRLLGFYGSEYTVLRVTYTGGYWSNPSDEDEWLAWTLVANRVVITGTDPGWSAGQKVRFQSLGALPTELVDGTDYYVKSAGANAYTVHSTQANAIAGNGSFVFITTGSGAMTVRAQNMPTGATELPDDLRMAWLLQCEQVWNVRDKLGTGITGNAGGSKLAQELLGYLELVPAVESIIQNYRRFASP